MTLQNFTLGTFAQGAAGGGGAFESIASVTASGGETSFTFNSIPSTYQHLHIRSLSRRNTTGSHGVGVRFNGDTSTNYVNHYIRAVNNVGIQVVGTTGENYIRCFSAASTSAGSDIFGVGIIDVLDYASSTKNTTVRSFGGYDDNNVTNNVLGLQSGLWLNTNAITSVTIYFGGDAVASGSTFALYGIKGA